MLFDDTIRANIAFGRPGATDAEIEQAARDAAAHGFVMAQPGGYDARVGDRGGNLSAASASASHWPAPSSERADPAAGRGHVAAGRGNRKTSCRPR